MKAKTMTVNQLHKALGQLIEQGHGRKPIAINKNTFTHNLEGDGCVVLPVVAVRCLPIVQIDDDGGTKVNRDGSESYKQTAVLLGQGWEGLGATP